METSVKQRIKDLIDKKSESVYAFSKQINVAQTTLSEYLNNGKKVSFTIIRAILEALPDVSAEWLMRGKGPMYISDLPSTDHTDTDEVLDLKAEITRLRAELAELREENVTLQADNRRLSERTDKLIDILYRDDEPQRKKA